MNGSMSGEPIHTLLRSHIRIGRFRNGMNSGERGQNDERASVAGSLGHAAPLSKHRTQRVIAKARVNQPFVARRATRCAARIGESRGEGRRTGSNWNHATARVLGTLHEHGYRVIRGLPRGWVLIAFSRMNGAISRTLQT